MAIEQALTQYVRNGSRVFIHGCCATPRYLNRILAERANQLRNVEIISLFPLDDAHTKPEMKDAFFHNSLFVSSYQRQCIADGQGSYIPAFLSEIPKLFHRKLLPVDVALIQVSPPDRHGQCSLGVSVDIAVAAVQNARSIIAQINRYMPRVFGDGMVDMRQFDAYIEHDEPLIELDYKSEVSQVETRVAEYVASLIDNGSTLQMGHGSIPDHVLTLLADRQNLGIHTEMFSDGIIPLIEKNVINNKLKQHSIGKSVCTFMMGTKLLYDFVNDNPLICGLDVAYVNDPNVIRKNPKMCSINSAIEIDLTGQVCAESIGTLQFSGVGGQLDFLRGAALSDSGKPILCLPSQTSKGISRIVPFLKQGAGVLTTRAHVHYVVTEYGIAYLFGKNYQQRAKALISIAHPDHRESLERAALERFKYLRD